MDPRRIDLDVLADQEVSEAPEPAEPSGELTGDDAFLPESPDGVLLVLR